jgi:hypothetical protein
MTMRHYTEEIAVYLPTVDEEADEIDLVVSWSEDGCYMPATRVDPEEYPDIEPGEIVRADGQPLPELTDDEYDRIWSAAFAQRDRWAE